MVIDFLKNSNKLGWRWDELKPDGDASSLVTQWHGIAHVGKSTCSYTMSLVDAESSPKKLDSWHLGDAVEDVSLRVNRGSIYVDSSAYNPAVDGLPIADTVDAIKRIASRYAVCTHINKANMKRLAGTIDNLWLQELILQSSGELFNVLIGAASEVQIGTQPKEVLARSLKDVADLRAEAFDSLKVRYEARGEVTLDGGLEGLRSILSVQLDEISGEVKGLLEQLREPTSARDIRRCAEKRLQNAAAELYVLSDLKMANSDTFLLLEEHLDDLQHEETAFAEAVQQAARANPQNTCLQRTCAETLRKCKH